MADAMADDDENNDAADDSSSTVSSARVVGCRLKRWLFMTVS